MKKDKHKDKAKKKPKASVNLKTEEKKEKKIKKDTDRKKTPFLQIDKNGDIFTNFFSNFFKQLRNPTKTGIGRLLEKFLVVKINERKKPEKPVEIMGSVKTILRYVKNDGNNNLNSPEKESLRQRTNQTLRNTVKQTQYKEESLIKPRKKGLSIYFCSITGINNI